MLENLLKNLPKDVVDAINFFLKNLVKELNDVEVYLFGSYARGDWIEDSDIDLAVVSPKFKDMPICDRLTMLRRLAPDTHAFEILAYTPKELEEAKYSVLIGDAMEYWIKLL